VNSDPIADSTRLRVREMRGTAPLSATGADDMKRRLAMRR
jgi:hypothetical protein